MAWKIRVHRPSTPETSLHERPKWRKFGQTRPAQKAKVGREQQEKNTRPRQTWGDDGAKAKTVASQSVQAPNLDSGPLGPVGVEDALIPLAFRYQIYQSRSANKPCPAEMLPGRPLQNQSDLFRALSFLNRPRATWCVGQVTDAMALSDSPACIQIAETTQRFEGKGEPWARIVWKK